MENTEYRINLTVKDLKECLKDLPDDMEVVVTSYYYGDVNDIYGFNHVRTVGVLSSEYEKRSVICLAPSGGGRDITTLIAESDLETVKCETLLF